MNGRHDPLPGVGVVESLRCERCNVAVAGLVALVEHVDRKHRDEPADVHPSPLVDRRNWHPSFAARGVAGARRDDDGRVARADRWLRSVS